MSDFQQNESEIITNINITPLVDIMLVLLIIFMLVSTITDFSSIKIELPEAASGKKIHDKTVSIMVSKEGDYYLAGKKEISMKEVALKLETMKKETPDIQVAISADKKVYYQEVIKVVDMVRKLEITRFAINVEHIEE